MRFEIVDLQVCHQVVAECYLGQQMLVAMLMPDMIVLQVGPLVGERVQLPDWWKSMEHISQLLQKLLCSSSSLSSSFQFELVMSMAVMSQKSFLGPEYLELIHQSQLIKLL